MAPKSFETDINIYHYNVLKKCWVTKISTRAYIQAQTTPAYPMASHLNTTTPTPIKVNLITNSIIDKTQVPIINLSLTNPIRTKI
jgi:hypothetical protein